MGEQSLSFVGIVGPWVQVLLSWGAMILLGWPICAFACWGERRLLRTGSRMLWLLPILVLAMGFLYGGLRFSGWLLFPADGWDMSGGWHYTNQNRGACVIYLCTALLVGVVRGVYKEKFTAWKHRAAA